MNIMDITSAILTLVPIGAALRIAILVVQLMNNPDDEKPIKNKIKHVLMIIVILNMANAIRYLLVGYYT